MRTICIFGIFFALVVTASGGYLIYKTKFIHHVTVDSTGMDDCSIIQESLLSDLCIMDLSYDGYETYTNRERNASNCLLIENPYLGKMCRRVLQRPHMALFMTNRYTPIPNTVSSFPPTCRFSDPYQQRYCAYILAATKSISTLGEFMDICNNFGDELAKGECLFYGVLPKIIKINGSGLQMIDALNDECDRISSPLWRMECHYLLADELTKLRGYEHISLKSIQNQCAATFDIGFYACYDHVTQLMQLEDAKIFCKGTEGTVGAIDCYTGIGKLLFKTLKGNSSEARDICKTLSADYEFACLRGFFKNLGFSLSGNFTELEKQCASTDKRLTQSCLLYSVYTVVTSTCKGTVEECAQICKSIFKGDAKLFCYFILGKYGIGYYSGQDVETAVRKCQMLPEDAESPCLEGLGAVMGNYLLENPDYFVTLCEKFPSHAVNDCYTSAGHLLAKHKDHNLSEAIALCNSLPEENKAYCIKGVSSYSSCDNSIANFPKFFESEC